MRHFLVLTGVIVGTIACAAAAHAQGVTIAEQKAASLEQSVLTSAKNLYAEASYEAALLQLNSSGTKEDVDQIDTYRALCLLALDRQGDAEQALEALVTRRPLYAINDTDYSPRLVTMFREVRKRVLPGAALQIYAEAKTEYENKNYELAVTKFRQLASVLNDPDASVESGRLADLRELADGFMKLSEQKLLDIPAPVAAQAPSLPAPAHAATRIYTAVDVGIQPPLAIQQAMPSWRAPQVYLRGRSYAGRLEIVIDEGGLVEKATLVKSITPSYDPLLLEAAKRWTYQPARFDGRPVKFVKILDITVNAGDGTNR
jgi:tetratricopeptide (TPR) repeat protein